MEHPDDVVGFIANGLYLVKLIAGLIDLCTDASLLRMHLLIWTWNVDHWIYWLFDWIYIQKSQVGRLCTNAMMFYIWGLIWIWYSGQVTHWGLSLICHGVDIHIPLSRIDRHLYFLIFILHTVDTAFYFILFIPYQLIVLLVRESTPISEKSTRALGLTPGLDSVLVFIHRFLSETNGRHSGMRSRLWNILWMLWLSGAAIHLYRD